jgi:hypothetical protein
MSTAYVTVTVVTILANAAVVVGDLLPVERVVANAVRVGVPRPWLPWLAAPKAAAAVGLLLGLAGVPVMSIAAASGLVLFFIGAVAAHIRARVYDTIAFPTAYLALALASLVLAVAESRSRAPRARHRTKRRLTR